MTAQEAIALVKAEIERRKERNSEQFKKGLISIDTLTARDGQLLSLNSFLDTIHVEEQPASSFYNLDRK